MGAGNLRGVVDALKQGANVDTRRGLAMRPREDIDSALDELETITRGMTPLMFAAQEGFVLIARKLMKAQADVNAVEEEDWVPLHFAVREGHFEIRKSLVRARANPYLANCDGDTPVTFA